MALNKEKILLLATILICALFLSLAGRELNYSMPRPGRAGTLNPTSTPPQVSNLAAPKGKVERVDVFQPPSETEPLRLIELEPPLLDPLPIVAPPTLPGPAPRAFSSLLVSGTTGARSAEAAEIPGEDTGESTGEEENLLPGTGLQNDTTGAQTQLSEGDLKKKYDWIKTNTGMLYYGYIHNPKGLSRFDLQRPLAAAQALKIQSIRTRTGEKSILMELTGDKIQSFGFADTIPNWVELSRRQIPRGAAYLDQRIAFIEQLLDKGEQSHHAFKEAYVQADMVIEDAPNEPRSYKTKAMVFFRMGELEQVHEFFQDLIQKKKFSKLAFPQLGMARLYHSLSLEKEAKDRLDHALRLEPAAWEVQVLMGQFWLDMGKYEVALRHLEKAARFIPASEKEKRFQNRNNLTTALIALGRFKEAFTGVEEAQSAGFADPRLDLLAGIAKLCLGEHAAAETSLTQAMTALPLQAGPGLALATTFALQGKSQQALDILAGIAQLDPLVRPRVNATQAWIYRRSGQFSRALELAEAGLKMAPDDAYLNYLTARLRRENGDPAGARTILSNLLTQYPKVPVLLVEMAAAADAEGILEQARFFVSRAIAVAGEDHPQCWGEFLGNIYLKMRRIVEAETLFNNEIRRTRSLHARVGLAQTRYYQGYKKACTEMLSDIFQGANVAGDPNNKWRLMAQRLFDQIRRHNLKSQVVDKFQEDVIHRNWTAERHGSAEPKIVDGKIRLAGKLTNSNRPLMLFRARETPPEFVSVEVECTIHPKHKVKRAGLRIGVRRQRSSGALALDPEISIFWDSYLGKPCTQITGSRIRKQKDNVAMIFTDPSIWQPNQPVRLKIDYGKELVEGKNAPRGVIRLYVNDLLVRKMEMASLGGGSSSLRIELFAAGKTDEVVDVSFDDFRLVRTSK